MRVVDDFDGVYGDDNNEKGYSVTASLAYRMTKNFFLHMEYNWIDSSRFSRTYLNLDINTTENQLQFAGRYFF